MGKSTHSHRGETSGHDVSNRTVLVLALVVIVVTIMSVVFYLQAVQDAQPKLQILNDKAEGRVELRILGPEEPPVTASGEVKIHILPPG